MPEDRRSERGSTPDALSTAPTSPVLVPGERVRVKSGAFAGKSGVVSGLDAKGQVLVILGQITVTLPPEEIELAPGTARGRSVLSSSHVKTARAGAKKAR